METTEGLAVSGQLYLISATQPCNLCSKENTVVALATKHLDAEDERDDEDGFLLSYIEELPAEVLNEILKRHPNFEICRSLTAGDSYFMTICACGGHYGDHYLQKQLLNQAFRTPDELKVEKLVEKGNWVIPCGYSQSLSVGELLGRTGN